MDLSLNHFSRDYRAARNGLLAAAGKAAGWSHQAHRHPLPGLDGEPIFVDTFWRGPAEASRVLVITAGTHGVEGFCGSALQSQFVADAPPLPDDTAVLMIHAVNPYGYSHLRRVNEDNVDVNRNFVDFDDGPPENTAYGEVEPLLNPTELPDGRIERIMGDLMKLNDSMGFLQFLKVVAGGQYAFSHGVQFGGREPTWSRRTVETIWNAMLAKAEIIVQFDIHTGFGPNATGTLMMAADPEEPHHALTQAWFGDMMITPRPKTREETILGGYLNGGLEQTMSEAWVIPMTLEYGTEPPEAVLAAMIEDNWLVHHGAIDSQRGHAIKARLREVFLPSDDEWRRAILARGRQVFSDALTKLAALEHRLDKPE